MSTQTFTAPNHPNCFQCCKKADEVIGLKGLVVASLSNTGRFLVGNIFDNHLIINL